MKNEEKLEEIIGKAIASALGSLDSELVNFDEACKTFTPSLERPRDVSNGDWASTVAMRNAKKVKTNPMVLAQSIVDNLPDNDIVESAEVVKPGFINFRLSFSALQSVISDVRTQRMDYGCGTIPEGQRYVNIEYISANPTGPMHVGHGRWAALGDAIARIMRHAGYKMYEEFYVNDHGTQMDIFGNSISIRYMQLLGHDVELSDESYAGDYIVDIAKEIIDENGSSFESMSEEERTKAFKEIGSQKVIENQKKILKKFGTEFDIWFSESSLYEVHEDGKNDIDLVLEKLDKSGYLYKKDGALWFRTTDFDDDKDRVLIKANGEYTYFISDVAYHNNKMSRGFDHLINLWGADHHGYIKRCEAMMAASGYPGKLEVVLGQMVNLLRDGKLVRMSKRKGDMVTFEELVEEVGVDATRFLLLSSSLDQAVDFDIEVAKRTDSSNPVYYVQYAHTRACSLLRKAAGVEDLSADELADKVIPDSVDLSPLTHETELALMRQMDMFGELVSQAARDRAPFKLTHYAKELASLFNQFYAACHILDEDDSVRNARLALVDATRILLKLVLSLLGISAPEYM